MDAALEAKGHIPGELVFAIDDRDPKKGMNDGGLGERYTRVAAAHAVHNGLTILPQTDKFLHGTKVAYGILVQSALLGQDDVLAQLINAWQRFNLPTTLAELDVDIHNRDELERVIAHTLRPVESIHYLPVELTPDVLRAAFEKVETFPR